MESVLEFDCVSYDYKDSHKHILDKASYSFQSGKIYAIVGPSGSGKTTTLVLAGGLDSPKHGSILYNGEDIKKKSLLKYRRQHVSMIFQQFNLIHYMNALENVLSAIEISKMKIDNKKDYCMNILLKLGLNKDECLRDIRKLSGGQQQRVAIARGIAKDAKLVLCDEPTGNLDKDNALDIIHLLIDLAHQQDKCVIVVTHSQELASLCDIQLQIIEGKLIER